MKALKTQERTASWLWALNNQKILPNKVHSGIRKRLDNLERKVIHWAERRGGGDLKQTPFGAFDHSLGESFGREGGVDQYLRGYYPEKSSEYTRSRLNCRLFPLYNIDQLWVLSFLSPKCLLYFSWEAYFFRVYESLPPFFFYRARCSVYYYNRQMLF